MRRDFDVLKRSLEGLSLAQARVFFAEHAPLHTAGRSSKVDHFVVLYMENHAASHFFGCMGLPGFDGVINHTIPVDARDPSKGRLAVECGASPNVCAGSPGYDR